jgi:hypothetical protein
MTTGALHTMTTDILAAMATHLATHTDREEVEATILITDIPGVATKVPIQVGTIMLIKGQRQFISPIETMIQINKSMIILHQKQTRTPHLCQINSSK